MVAVTAPDVLFGVALLSGFVLWWLGYHSLRTREGPGVMAFAAFAIVLGLGGIAGGAVGAAGTPVAGDDAMPTWTQVAFLCWGLSAVPWFLFALQYTGRYTKVTWRTVGLLSVPFAAAPVSLGLEFVGGVGGSVIASLVGALLFTYVFLLVTVGIYLVLRTTREYGHLSLLQGTALSLAPFVPFLTLNTTGIFEDATVPAAIGLFVGGFVAPAIALGIALFRYDTFETTPAVGAIGERTIVQETDDLVFVVDRHDRVITCNETATETLDASGADSAPEAVTDVLGTPVDELREGETVSLETEAGTRSFDPQVAAITDQHGRELGFVLSLRDVTERELREQRLAVLNRILRHNLRNRIDVIKSHAEVVARERNDDHARAITETADALAELGRSARSIDRFVSDASAWERVDLVAAVRNAIATVDGQESAVSLELDLPESAPIVTNEHALAAALESAIENAITYADSTVTIAVETESDGSRIRVADDGPGIPESELETLDRGTETPLQHGTGLGLWQLQWAVTALHGELSFDTTDGTTVEFTVPDRGSGEDPTRS